MNLNYISQARQLIIVVTNDWCSVKGELWYFERDSKNNWKSLKAGISIVVGKKGLAWESDVYKNLGQTSLKSEGDSKAPAGILKIGRTFGFDDKDMPREDYISVKTGIECVDDSNSRYYNQIINSVEKQKDWQSSENMAVEPLYKYGIEVLYNSSPVIAKKGSCIFMHVWRSSSIGTEGCTAMSEGDIKFIQQALDLDMKPVLVQLPRCVYDNVQEDWQLPNLF